MSFWDGIEYAIAYLDTTEMYYKVDDQYGSSGDGARELLISELKKLEQMDDLPVID